MKQTRFTEAQIVGILQEADANGVAMAFAMFKSLNQGRGAFTEKDGSKEYRLYTMANQVKHTDSCIRSGQCTSADTVPLWLTNEGLASFGVEVLFSEAAEVLSDLAQLAHRLQDPRGFVHGGQGG